MIIYTSYASRENLKKFIELNYLPIIVLRNIRNSKLLSPYSDTCIHLRDLSPSTELYQSWKNGEIDIKEYKNRYLFELIDRRLNTQEIYKNLEFLIELTEAKGIILLGYEEDYKLCHRSFLAEFLGELWGMRIWEWTD